MEYWLNAENLSQEKIYNLLDCQLYNAIKGDPGSHFTKPKRIITLQIDTVFEGIEIISSLSLEYNWIINPIHDIASSINYEFIKQFIKNKKELPHIQLAPVIHLKDIEAVQHALNIISYGSDYIILYSEMKGQNPLESMKWIAQFRDKGFYKTKIIVFDKIHKQCMIIKDDIFYDGIIFTENGILSGKII
jgi:hypothetical protein